MTPQLLNTLLHWLSQVCERDSGTQQAPVLGWQTAFACAQQSSLQQGSHGSQVCLLVQVLQVPSQQLCSGAQSA
jgi:hypothetical protein